MQRSNQCGEQQKLKQVACRVTKLDLFFRSILTNKESDSLFTSSSRRISCLCFYYGCNSTRSSSNNDILRLIKPNIN